MAAHSLPHSDCNLPRGPELASHWPAESADLTPGPMACAGARGRHTLGFRGSRPGRRAPRSPAPATRDTVRTTFTTKRQTGARQQHVQRRTEADARAETETTEELRRNYRLTCRNYRHAALRRQDGLRPNRPLRSVRFRKPESDPAPPTSRFLRNGPDPESSTRC